jgi:excisionase family DNA binding protein
VDALTRAVADLVTPLVRDLVAAEVQRAVAELGPTDSGERLYTVRTAAQRLDMGESTLRRHIAEGRLKVTRVPGRIDGATEQRVRGADLDAFVLQLAGADRPVARRRRGDVRARRSGGPKSLNELVRERLSASG